ncbi:helix-turn-helix domain-containing protein [Fulvivirga ulvae]|uniref:DUF6597 domain-containing transcriptional factor n=1 Tax=Fulvivirga ulvae TaxID=2904245 RepID=UPI001F1A8835|nr:DUF6597 domain-containing transcriptional factor [Fulvivirga ulvae]UII32952.1 helix-turn-helix domain-containing protein [Fulvivirga ulvae]
MLRHLYKPLQPTVQHLGHIGYREVLPSAVLQSFIYCYWELVSSKELDAPFSYQIVADGCIDIFFDAANPEESYVMGYCDSHTSFALTENFHYIGIRFFPAVFPQLYRINAIELTNRAEFLNAISPSTARLLSGLEMPATLAGIRNKLDKHFIHLFSRAGFKADPRFYHALDLIFTNQGRDRIESGFDVGVSSRQLRRLFGNYIGGSVKAFSNVVRFQQILHSAALGINPLEQRAFLDHYYDQAHFIKEFKRLYGITPGRVQGW